MKKIINMTPHDIVIVGQNGNRTIPHSGQVARVSYESFNCGFFEDIPLMSTTFGVVTGLPNYQSDTLLIVSAVVRAVAFNRPDLASPGELVRDAGGNVVGCRGLIVDGGAL